MLTNPPIGKPVCIHYRASMNHLPNHHRIGTVAIRSQGKPRNHLIKMGFGKRELVCVPCGNLFTLNQVKKFMENKSK